MTIEREPGPEGLSFSGSLRVRGTGTWIYVSGKFGTDESGKFVDGGLAEQARAALENVLRAVRAAGGAPSDVVKVTAYLTSLDDYARYNVARAEVFGSCLPASTAIAIAGLIAPEALIEIDAVAFVPEG